MSLYRRLGADAPGGDPRRAHGGRMEGYYWRLTDPDAGRVIVALCGVCRDRRGPWALVALAEHPGGLRGQAIADSALARTDAYAVRAGELLAADEKRLAVDLGDDARIEVDVTDGFAWPRRTHGGLGPAGWIPGLGQYWHPHLLGGRVRGSASLGGEAIDLDGWQIYAEKNWGDGFPGRWWWGQAQGFERDDVCVAFAGGQVLPGPAALTATAIVVRLGGELVRLSPPAALVRVDTGAAGWRLEARGPRHRVSLEGAATADPCMLPVPIPAERRSEPRAAQQLAGELRVEVRRGRRLLFGGESRLAGLEHGRASG